MWWCIHKYYHTYSWILRKTTLGIAFSYKTLLMKSEWVLHIFKSSDTLIKFIKRGLVLFWFDLLTSMESATVKESTQLLESYNHRITGLKRPLRSLSPAVNLTLPILLLNYVPKNHISSSFKYFQGWWLNHLPGQPIPKLDNPFSDEVFSSSQTKPPLAHLEAVSSCPVDFYLGEEASSHLLTTSF